MAGRQRDMREVREIRERAAVEEAMHFVFRLYPPRMMHPEPEIQNANRDVTEEWDSKLVISAGGDHVSSIARPCPLNPPSEDPN